MASLNQIFEEARLANEQNELIIKRQQQQTTEGAHYEREMQWRHIEDKETQRYNKLSEWDQTKEAITHAHDKHGLDELMLGLTEAGANLNPVDAYRYTRAIYDTMVNIDEERDMFTHLDDRIIQVLRSGEANEDFENFKQAGGDAVDTGKRVQEGYLQAKAFIDNFN